MKKFQINKRSCLKSVLSLRTGNQIVKHLKDIFCTGDFNGDGKMEVLVIIDRLGTTPTACYSLDMNTGKILYSGDNMVDAYKTYVMDFDGDGKSEICLINKQGTFIYKATTDGISLVSSYTGLKIQDLEYRQLLLGDLNGDGKPDFILSPMLYNNIWKVFYGTGNNSFYSETFKSTTNENGVKFLLQDVDRCNK